MKILLIGDACLDIWIEGDARRLSPEAPIAVFEPKSRKDVPGMAGNVFENLKSLAAYAKVVALLSNSNAVKVRHVDAKTGHHFLRVDSGVTTGALDCNEFAAEICNHYPQPLAVVVSDYCKGFLDLGSLMLIGEICAMNNIPWFVDTKRIIGPWAKGCILKINQQELEANIAAGVRPWEHVMACIVTNGAQGMDLYGSDGQVTYHVQGPVVEVRDGAGCGDSVLAALAIRYLEKNGNIRDAMEWADKVGRVAVSKRGVVAVKREEVQ